MKLRTLLTASFASTALLAAAPSAFAAPNADGLYLGIGTGFSSLENDDNDVDNFISNGAEDFDLDDDEDNVFKGFVGYEFNPYFATEIFLCRSGSYAPEG